MLGVIPAHSPNMSQLRLYYDYDDFLSGKFLRDVLLIRMDKECSQSRYSIKNNNVDVNRSKLLVCHDMKNNYLEDQWSRGSYYNNAFQLLHFQNIDVFCYFSHHFITIPSSTWTNVCHRHGVPVLGTLITEWESGYDICKRIFKSKSTVNDFIGHLLLLIENCGFDGFLVNIENRLDVDIQPEGLSAVSLMLYFLEAFTSRLHHIKSHGLVLW